MPRNTVDDGLRKQLDAATSEAWEHFKLAMEPPLTVIEQRHLKGIFGVAFLEGAMWWSGRSTDKKEGQQLRCLAS